MKALIYDLDGVIVDTAKYHYLGWKKLADELKIPFDEEKNEKLKGVSRRDSLLILLGYTPSEDKIKEWSDRKNGYYLEYIKKINESDILPGAIEFLKDINANTDWKQALASSSKNAKMVLEALDIIKYFDAIVDGTEIINTKPDPEIFLKAAEKLGVSSDNAIVFEDAEAGVEAAKKAKMKAVGIGSKDILFKADKVIRNLSEITIEEVKKILQ